MSYSIALIALTAIDLADGGQLRRHLSVAICMNTRVRLDARGRPEIHQRVRRVKREKELGPQQHQACENGEARLQSAAAEAVHDGRTVGLGAKDGLDSDQSR